MLGIQNSTTGVVEPLNIDEDSWYVTHKYNGGDTLTFEVPIGSEYYKKIAEEVKIEFRSDRSNDAIFVIKNVDEHSDFVSVDAELDLEEWKKSIRDAYRRTNVYLYQVLDEIKPAGWTYVNASSVSDRTTVEDTEGEPLKAVTPLEILDACIEAYGVVFNFDVVNRVLTVVDLSDDTPTGEFFSDELNLRSIGYVGNSSGFATRLYAYGKRDENGENPLTFASINGGKPYVDDNSYSNKVICVGWSDERYTVKEHLLNDARKKLKELAIPERSYVCDVISFEANMWMYKVVTVVSRTKGYRVNHRVIEWEEHQNKEDDKITLSAVPPSVEGLVRNLRDGNSQLRKDMDAGFDSIEGIIKESIEHATDMITGSYGGYFRWIRDIDGHPMELVNLGDSMNIDDAKKVWRWNKNGLGHSNDGYNGPYTLAILADGSINASVITSGTLNANVIRAGILQDASGLNFWDLNTGEFQMAVTSTFGSKTVQEIIDGVDEAAKVATNYLTFSSDKGLDVGYSGTSAKTRINGSGMEVFDGSGVSSAKLTAEEARIGRTDRGHTVLKTSQLALVGADGVPRLQSVIDGSNAATLTSVKINDYVGYGGSVEVDELVDMQNGRNIVLHVIDQLTYTSHAWPCVRGTSKSGHIYTDGGDISVGYDGVKTFTLRGSSGNIYVSSCDYEMRIVSSYATIGTSADVGKRAAYSTVAGQGLYALNDGQLSFGKYNTHTSGLLLQGGYGSSATSRNDKLRLTTTGNLWIAGALTQNSDKRLKEHHSYLEEDAAQFVRDLKPALYTKDGERHVGFYAQDVQAAEPDGWDTVTVTEQHTDESLDFDPLALDYTALIAPLVAYAQSLEKRIAALEERLV